MVEHHNNASGVGLERLCSKPATEWMQSHTTEYGVESLEAQFQESAYHKHRHDTYAICLTITGVQGFDYRGAAEISLPGQVVVLHPDELHDGHAATAAGFGYRILYIEPALIYDATQIIAGRTSALPFVRTPVINSPKLAAAINSIFQITIEPLAIDHLVLQLAEGLIEAEQGKEKSMLRQIDSSAIARACQYLDAEQARVVRSEELEALTGLTRYDLARQFRMVCGTSPYRYLLMRRLDTARKELAKQRPLAEIALDAGFADQAHFTRMFKAAFGMTPARYGGLISSATQG